MDDQDLDFFKTNGYVVIENVFTDDQVYEIRNLFHKKLESLGIFHNNILNGVCDPPIQIRKKSPVAEMFYESFKIKAQIKLYDISKSLMNATYSSGKQLGFEHPYIPISDQVYPYIDRIGYRLPDHIRAEPGLGLHIDRNPYAPYKHLKKYRPIQSFISLVDHYGNKSGGLRLVPKFHLEYDNFFKNFEKDENIKGEFFRMNSKSFQKVENQLKTIDIPKGSVVYWDSRLPHATCDNLVSLDSREVIYFSFLPAIQLNKDYCIKQAENIKNNKCPPAYDDCTLEQNIDWDINQEEFKLFRVFD